MKHTIYIGDSLKTLKTLPTESVDCVITSPPYYSLRNYNVTGQIGLEPTMGEYLNKLLSITTELKRVLKKTGTMFWNHGDSYGGSWQDYGTREGNQREKTTNSWSRGGSVKTFPPSANMLSKSLMLQNFRLVQRMSDEQGWILRNVIIWHKSNCMPSSVKDRYSVDFEPIFFFVKSNSPQYWTNEERGRTVGEVPKGSQGVENEDWEWRDCPKCSSKSYFNYRTRDAKKKEQQAPQFKMSDAEKGLAAQGKCLRCKGGGQSESFSVGKQRLLLRASV
jgi:hypothetical protein